MCSRIVIDCLSVIAIHLVIDETNQLLPQLVSQNMIKYFYTLLQSPLVEVREYSFKLCCLLLSKSEEFRTNLDYSTVEDLLITTDQSMSLCMIILDCSIGKYINVNDLTPEDDSNVIQMMNASTSAQKIVS